MTFYRLSTELTDLDFEDHTRRLVEATTEDAISYIPAHLGTVKAKIKNLAQEKPEWGIQVLEDQNFKTLQIENRMRIIVPNEHWDNFLQIFDGGKLEGRSYLNLRTILKEVITEAVKDNMKNLRKDLKPALTEMFNERDSRAVDKIASVWKSWFGLQSYRTDRGVKGPIVSCERKTKDIQQLYGKLLREYGKDKGNLEMLLEDIDKNRPLNTYDIFKDHSFLYGTRIQSSYERVTLIFEAMIDTAFNSTQSLYIEDGEVLDEIDDQIREVKRVGNVLYPIGGQFDFNFLRILKEVIEDATSKKEEEEER